MLYITFFILALILSAVRGANTVGDNSLFQGVDIEYALAEPYTDRRSNNSSDPLLGILVFVVVFTFIFSPIIGVISLFVSIFAYRFIKNNERNQGATKRRKEALLRAGVFLSPYTDIWRNLTLSNKYCSLKLKQDGTTIIALEKMPDANLPYRTFKITKSTVFDNAELWNLFCLSFAYNTSFDGLIECCDRFRASAIIDVVTPPKKKQPQIIEKVDVNNATGAELTALPGISIVISKKIIKKREELGGFKNVEEFLTFLNLKPNVTENLRQRICVKKMNGVIIIERTEERRIDL